MKPKDPYSESISVLAKMYKECSEDEKKQFTTAVVAQITGNYGKSVKELVFSSIKEIVKEELGKLTNFSGYGYSELSIDDMKSTVIEFIKKEKSKDVIEDFIELINSYQE